MKLHHLYRNLRVVNGIERIDYIGLERVITLSTYIDKIFALRD